MKLSFVGLGYVGLVSSICLSSNKHQIFGYDKSKEKIDSLCSKKLYIDEKDLSKIFEKNYKQFIFSNSINDNLFDSDLVFICVDTPYDNKNVLNLTNLYSAVQEIADNKKDSRDLTILIRSTIPPGTIDGLNSKYSKHNLIFISNPEFLREGNAVEDFFEGDVTVIGGNNKVGIDLCLELYKNFRSEKIVTNPKNAELIKFVNNSFHALKITFANEIGQICSSLDINSNELMHIFKSDKQLNISEKYLTPGFAYGGSCLPKDTNGLKNLAKSLSVSVPIISSIAKSNNELIKKTASMINKISPKNILIFGIAFKKGTDDLRGSPILELSKLLNLDELHFIDEKIEKDNLLFNNVKFVKEDMDYEPKNFDIIIFNHSSIEKKLTQKVYNSRFIFDLNNVLDLKENVIRIT